MAGIPLGSGALGESETYLENFSYSQIRSALVADATTSIDASAVASLPTSSPVAGATWWTTTAQAKALGLAPAQSPSTDGYVGFSSVYPFTYNDLSGVAPGTFDFEGTVMHEITEVMGRQLLTGATIGGLANSYTVYDLFHYSAPGVRDFSASTPGYFSVNGGVTNLDSFNTNPNGDAGDWATSVPDDAADAFSSSGVINQFSTADVDAMDAIGWNAASSSSGSTAPTGVAVAASLQGLANATGVTGLNAGAALANVAEKGGVGSDKYAYILGGSGDAGFRIVGTALDTGSVAVPGAVNGKLFALIVTADDTTNGTSSPAQSVNVVVGSAGADTINLASLSGMVTNAPTFIYGLGGGDTVNGSGMTGALFFDSAAGSDTFTGGRGSNFYLYGAAVDSTRASPDFITNFSAGADTINLYALNPKFAFAGQITGSTIAANSVGWQTSGGNTQVYVNTSSAASSLSAAAMEINLAGTVALSAHNVIL